MDVTGKDFSLNFRGFEHNDPETVRRFTAFCAKNFSLTPDKATSLAACADTIILTSSASLEELEALAKVLREIGARVDVCEREVSSLSSFEGLPTTQDLHRLFHDGAETPLALEEIQPRVRARGTSREKSALYLLRHLDGASIHDTATIQYRKSWQYGAPRRATQVDDSPTRLLGPRVVLLAGLILAIALITGFVWMQRGTELVKAPGKSGNAASASAMTTLGKPVVLLGTARSSGAEASMRALASANSLSLSYLSISPLAANRSATHPTVRRIEVEPSFLGNIAPNIWKGTVQLSILTIANETLAHTSRGAEVTIVFNPDMQSALATIDASQTEVGGTPQSSLAMEEWAHALDLSDIVPLTIPLTSEQIIANAS